jgi:hypothetical protein
LHRPRPQTAPDSPDRQRLRVPDQHHRRHPPQPPTPPEDLQAKPSPLEGSPPKGRAGKADATVTSFTMSNNQHDRDPKTNDRASSPSRPCHEPCFSIRATRPSARLAISPSGHQPVWPSARLAISPSGPPTSRPAPPPQWGSPRSPLHFWGSPRSPLGGGERIRTADPLLAKQVLSQLSYAPRSQSRRPWSPDRPGPGLRSPTSEVSDREGMRRRRRRQGGSPRPSEDDREDRSSVKSASIPAGPQQTGTRSKLP